MRNSTPEMTINRLRAAVGPLGPQGSLEARRREQNQWIQDLDAEDAVALEAILSQSPAKLEENGFDALEARELAASGLVQLAQEDQKSKEILVDLLANEEAEVVLIDSLAEWDTEETIELLAMRQIKAGRDGTLIAIAEALGNMSGPAAVDTLQQMRDNHGDRPAVLREIDSALTKR